MFLSLLRDICYWKTPTKADQAEEGEASWCHPRDHRKHNIHSNNLASLLHPIRASPDQEVLTASAAASKSKGSTGTGLTCEAFSGKSTCPTLATGCTACGWNLTRRTWAASCAGMCWESACCALHALATWSIPTGNTLATGCTACSWNLTRRTWAASCAGLLTWESSCWTLLTCGTSWLWRMKTWLTFGTWVAGRHKTSWTLVAKLVVRFILTHRTCTAHRSTWQWGDWSGRARWTIAASCQRKSSWKADFAVAPFSRKGTSITRITISILFFSTSRAATLSTSTSTFLITSIKMTFITAAWAIAPGYQQGSGFLRGSFGCFIIKTNASAVARRSISRTSLTAMQLTHLARWNTVKMCLATRTVAQLMAHR